jgi:hypothetical protein
MRRSWVRSSPTAPSKMHTIDKGEVARYLAVAHLMKLGFVVSVPLTENSSYDLIVDDKGKLLRTQVKKATLSEGVLKISLHTNSHNTNVVGTVKKYTAKDFDLLVAVYVEENKFYKLDYSAGEYDNRNGIWLRIDTPQRERKNIKYAKDYEF